MRYVGARVANCSDMDMAALSMGMMWVVDWYDVGGGWVYYYSDNNVVLL